MTLIVGGISEGKVWLCSDAAITDPTASIRTRGYGRKIEPIGKTGLLGFAGPVEVGALAAHSILNLESSAALQELLAIHSKYREANFLYAYFANGKPKLARVGDGKIEHSSSFFVGDQPAYEQFQKIRLADGVSHVPDALHTLICALKGDFTVPEGLSETITAMLELFATTSDRTVGGWAAPYVLTTEGSLVCNYAYSVTDPIVSSLKMGDEIPHGTPERGGFGLSFTELREEDGIAVYWLQKPGGKVFIKHAHGYDEHEFDGTPEQFKAAIFQKLHREVDVWFGGEQIVQPDQIEVMRDGNKEPRAYLARSGQTLSFSWANNPNGPFSFGHTVDLKETPVGECLNEIGAKVSVTDDGNTIQISLGQAEINLTAAETDALMAALASERAKLAESIPFEIAQGTRLNTIIDPAWRTRPAPHPSIAGPLLALRHPGFGWQAFILPRHEAQSLGKWLAEYTESTKPRE